MAEDIRDDDQTEIAFESDLDLEDVTNWNNDEEKKDKDSLHKMRSKKINKDKDDDKEKD